MRQKTENLNPGLSEQLNAIQQELRKLQRQNTYLYKQQVRQSNEQLNFQALQSQLQSLHQRLDGLQQNFSKDNKSFIEESTNQFLLAEFSEVCKFWMHTDARLESSLRLYLTVSAVILSAAVFVGEYQISTGNLNFIAPLIFLSALPLAIAGFFVVSRMLGAVLEKTGYTYSLNLIRRFFAQRSPEIVPYLYLPFADELIQEGTVSLKKIRALKGLLHASLIRVVMLWSALLMGISLGTFHYILLPSSSKYAYGLTGFLTLVLCLLGSHSLNQRKINRTIKFLSSRRKIGITSMLESRDV